MTGCASARTLIFSMVFGLVSLPLFIARPAVSQSAVSETTPVQNYTGTIVLFNGQRYILRDDQNNTWYHLDDQKKAAQFLGKKVMVTGKLDLATDFIYIQNIQSQA